LAPAQSEQNAYYLKISKHTTWAAHYSSCHQCFVRLKLHISLVKHQSVCPCHILETADNVSLGKQESSLQTTGMISQYASKALQNELFSIMTIDEVSEIAQTDKLIISFQYNDKR